MRTSIQRRFKLSGRKNLDRSRLRIEVSEGSEDTIPSFTATINLSGLAFPPEAKVVVEPYVKHTSMRFDFGTVEAITPPKDTKLSELDLGASVLFRVKILHEDEAGHGRIIASADRLRPMKRGDDKSRKSLIHVNVTKALGNEVWRINFDSDNEPELALNSSIPDAQNRLISDPVFCSLILPTALRQVLTQIFSEEEYYDESPDHWASRWIEFGKTLIQREHVEDGHEDWIDEVVNAFCEKNQMCSQLAKAITGGSQ